MSGKPMSKEKFALVASCYYFLSFAAVWFKMLFSNSDPVVDTRFAARLIEYHFQVVLESHLEKQYTLRDFSCCIYFGRLEMQRFEADPRTPHTHTVHI